MKKIISILLTLVMMFSFVSVTAFADTPVQNNGVIYINNASNTTVYKVYKLFDLESMASSGQESYSYSLTDTIPASNPWLSFLQDAQDKEGNALFTIEQIHVDQTTVTYSVTKTDFFTESVAVDFAKAALIYANDSSNTITPITTSDDDDHYVNTNGVGKFTGLSLGYYLVDSSVGSLCGLTTTKPEASITVKNNAPTVDKTVQEDSLAGSHSNSWLKSNTAEIGQIIKFDVTIFAQAGAENYVYHDKMNGMVFMDPSVNTPFQIVHSRTIENDEKIIPQTEEINGEQVANYEILKNGCGCGCTFAVKFHQGFLDTIKANDKVSIEYCGKLYGDAVVGEGGNKNIGWLTYGDRGDANNRYHSTATTETTTYTYGCDIVKTDQNYNPLSGATFKLYAAEGAEKREVKLAYNPSTNTYRICNRILDGEEAVTDNIITVNANSQDYAHGFTVARIVGLDNGVYYVREMTPPDGYNRLTNDVSFTVSNAPYYATFTMTTDNDSENYSYNRGSGVHIENKQGATMPETGGTGTVMFITTGTIMVLGAGVLLVTKKRMSMIED